MSKRDKTLGLFIILIGFCWILFSLANNESGIDYYSNRATDPLSYKVMQVESGWAYEIYAMDTLLIRQQNIPGVQGKQQFDNAQQARSVALLVIKRLEKGEPPSISTADLDYLGIDYK